VRPSPLAQARVFGAAARTLLRPGVTAAETRPRHEGRHLPLEKGNEPMRPIINVWASALLMTVPLSLACGKHKDAESADAIDKDGPVEKAGEATDEAAEDTADAVDEAADDVKDAADKDKSD
jgi:hypothetical protein